MIIESGFTSGVDMASRIYWFLPARLITRLEFPLADYASAVTCPSLVIHSRDDEIIRFMLKHQVHGPNIVPGMSPITLRIDIG